jgi:hypothetical protein
VLLIRDYHTGFGLGLRALVSAFVFGQYGCELFGSRMWIVDGKRLDPHRRRNVEFYECLLGWKNLKVLHERVHLLAIRDFRPRRRAQYASKEIALLGGHAATSEVARLVYGTVAAEAKRHIESAILQGSFETVRRYL